MQISNYIDGSLDQSSNELKLTLLTIPMAEQNFPIDRWGQFNLIFQNKKYKFQPYVLQSSEYLRVYFEQNPNENELKLTLKSAKSEKAFDLVMKILYGMKNIAIPRDEYIQVLIVMEELKISGERGFKQQVIDAIVERLDENLALEAYEMSFNFNVLQLKERSLQLLNSRGFEDLINQKDTLNAFSEPVFESLLEAYYDFKRRRGEDDTSQFLKARDVALVIKDYCQANFKESNVYNKRVSKYLHLATSGDPDETTESLEVFADDGDENDVHSVRRHLQLCQSRMTKLEKQNAQLLKEVLELKKQILSTSHENSLLKQLVSQIVLQNEELSRKVSSTDELCLETKENVGSLKTLSEDTKTKLIELLNRLPSLQSETKSVVTAEILDKTSVLQNQLAAQAIEISHIIQVVNEIKTGMAADKTSSDLQKAASHKNSFQQPSSVVGSFSLQGQGIIVKGFSTLLKSEHLQTIVEWIPKPQNTTTCKLSLIYKGTKDGFRAETFHQKCCGPAATITFLQSKTHKRLFGGYTEESWELSFFDKITIRKSDDKAFLFSLTYNEKYPVLKGRKAIYTCSRYLTNFGQDDIVIVDECNISGESNSKFPSAYQGGKFSQVTEESKAHLAGSHKFTIEEIEVYKVDWN